MTTPIRGGDKHIRVRIHSETWTTIVESKFGDDCSPEATASTLEFVAKMIRIAEAKILSA